VHQLGQRSFSSDTAVSQHDNVVRALERLTAVRDGEHGSIRICEQPIPEFVFSFDVERAREIVDDEQLGSPNQGPSGSRT
jgi:hypothetical protein